MALTKAMAEAAGEAGWYTSWATSNDIVDSAVALQIKDSIKIQFGLYQFNTDIMRYS